MRWILPIGLIFVGCGDDGGATKRDAAVADVLDLDGEGIPDGGGSGSGGEALWAHSFGLTGNLTPVAMAVDTTGASLYTGYVNGSLNFAGTGASGTETLTTTTDGGYLGKLDADGNHVWSKKWESATPAGFYPLSVAVGANNDVFIAGQLYGSVTLGTVPIASTGTYAAFVAKFDSGGNHVWSKPFGGAAATQAYATSVSTDATGNVVVTGYFTGTIDFGGGGLSSAGGRDYFVAKLDASGNYIWADNFGDAADQANLYVAVDKTTGAMNLVGNFAGTVNFGGNDLTASGTSGFIAQLDSNGQHAWSKLLLTASPHTISTDGSSNIYYAGGFTGTVDFAGTGTPANLTAGTGTNIFMVKLTSAGAHSFSQYFNSTSLLNVFGIAASSAGVVTITGEYRTNGPVNLSAGGVAAAPLTCMGARVIYAGSFTTAGAHRWSRCVGGTATSLQEGLAVAVAPTGHVILNGDFYNAPTTSIAFPKSGGGTITLTRAATTDVFAAKLEP